MLYTAHKGKSNLMLNRAKRYEREAKESAQKGEKYVLESQIENLQKEVEKLKEELLASQYDINLGEKNAELLHKLFIDKVIDDDGNPI